MATCADTFAPKVCSQVLTRGSGSADCGPCCVVEALFIASCGKHTIGGRDRRVFLVEKIRRLGGADLDKGTSTTNAQMRKAYLSTYFENQFKALGLRPPRATKEFRKEAWSLLTDQLDMGRWASLSVRYGPIDDWHDHAVSGQWGYTGPHQIVIGRKRVKNGTTWVTSVDPLCDGRFSGFSDHVVADGPQAIPLSVIKDASELYSGTNKASFFAFWPVAKLASSDPGTGKGTTTVPNIVNVVEATALASLATAGLEPGNREEDYHATIVAGRVISTDPVAGVTVQKGVEVDYVVSLGTAPAAPASDPSPADPCSDPSGSPVFSKRRRPCGCDD